MSQYYLFQDTKKCIGCHACEIQCKTNKDLPEGPKPCQIIQVGPKFINHLPKMSFIFMPCFHCEDPWCVSACPTGAMQQRSSDGIVFVQKDLCVGCKTCISACPWGAPQGQAEIQVLHPTHRSFCTNTIPSEDRCCMAPVGQADTHQGSSQ